MSEKSVRVKVNYMSNGPHKIEVKPLPEFYIIVSSRREMILAGEIRELLARKTDCEEMAGVVAVVSDERSDDLLERVQVLFGLKIDYPPFDLNDSLPIGRKKRKKYHRQNKTQGDKRYEKNTTFRRKFQPVRRTP
jgi:hypothetical protein